VSFLDDDVVVTPGWAAALTADLEAAEAAGAVGSQAVVTVPEPQGRRPTDDERATLGLVGAAWITADLTYRRAALAAVGGFDERFRRAFREDSDLALRLGADDGTVLDGRRETLHPLRPEGGWMASVRRQAGNADDVLMRRLHGPDWRERARAGRGRPGRHAAVTAAGLTALAAALTGRRRTCAGAAALWLLGTAEFAAGRVLAGPRDRHEVGRMLLSSALIPPVAVGHTLAGLVRHRDARPWRGVPELVLFDRDGTLIEDVPYNGDPDRVRPVPGARDALDRLRSAGVQVGVVTNQSGIGRGRLTDDEVTPGNHPVSTHRRPNVSYVFCPHSPEDGCECRKPRPGMVVRSADAAGVPPERCVVVGDIGADVEAAEAAGATGVLVPTPVTREEEVRAARHVVPSLDRAVDLILAGGLDRAGES
jgi:histidinol-phosphate phosphatase family protein